MQQRNVSEGGKTSPFPSSEKRSGHFTPVHVAAWLSILYGAALLGLFPAWLVSNFHSTLGFGIELDILLLPLETIAVVLLVIFGPLRNIRAGVLLLKKEDKGKGLVIDALFFDTLLLFIYFGYYGRASKIIEKISDQPYILIPLLLLYHVALLWSLKSSKKHLRKTSTG